MTERESFVPETDDPVDLTWTDAAGSTGNAPGAHSLAADDSVTETAKEHASQVGRDAVSSGNQVAGVTAEQTQAVVSEAGAQARNVMSEARSQLTDQASTQQDNLATWVRSLAEDLGSMVDRSDSGDAQGGVATGLARQASDRAHAAATWLGDHEPSDLFNEVSRFARHRPGTFLALAAVGGLLAGRLTRGLTADGSASGPQPRPTSLSSEPVVTPEVERAASLSTDTPWTSETSIVDDSDDHPSYDATEQGGR